MAALAALSTLQPKWAWRHIGLRGEQGRGADRCVALRCRHCFGVAGRQRDGLAFLDEGVAVYVAGHSIVVYQADTRTQKFVHCSAEAQGISAFAVCSSKHVLALAERGEKASITIIDLQTFKRRKVLSSNDATCKVGWGRAPRTDPAADPGHCRGRGRHGVRQGTPH